MSLSKLLAQHERESLYSGANSAVWYSHNHATKLAKRGAREEDYVATLITNGIPNLANRWAPLLHKKGVGLKLSGVFCHGHPQVAFGTPRSQVELADLLVVHQHTQNDRCTARAMLLQAKMSSDSTHTLVSTDAQLRLFSVWPPFEFVTGGLAPGERDLREKGSGSRYALVLNRAAYPEQITWADQCPWGASPATQHLSADRSLAKLLGDILLGKDGRPFRLGTPKDDWSRTIQELLEVTGRRTYKRANIERGDTGRLVAAQHGSAGLMLVAESGPTANVNSKKSNESLNERFFGHVPGAGTDGGGVDIASDDRSRNSEGGISALIIETTEGPR